MSNSICSLLFSIAYALASSLLYSDNQINDLHKRIQQTRWPDEINDQYWSHGTKMSFLKDLSKYWVDEFNWKDQEKKINDIGSFKFKTNSGLSIHFLHAKSNHKDAVPLVMTHGWPGSIQEFIKIIPIIQKESKIPVDIICPSLPGFGFSDKPKSTGMNSKEIAKLQHELVMALGYKKYVVQGGDWGATVSKWMAELFPEHCIGIHLNLVIAFPPNTEDPMEGVTDKELKLLENFNKYKTQGYGYYEIHKTKPQTIGYGLNDSPVGLAAWISEKFYGWFEGNDNNLVVTNDEVLSIISLYWFTESITSSARLYKENGDFGFSFNSIQQPMAGAIFKKDIMLPPKVWAENIYNIVQWNEYDGGHFAALEKPMQLARDINLFIQKLNLD
ncbi:epoxide hydrolase [Gammaproteobacteria bacterium]|nr:epoxide hydrolase [Gammaproteobacteria bacterium]